MTAEYAAPRGNFWSWMWGQILMGKRPGEYFRSLLTPFNAVAALIMVTGAVVAFVRFTQGLGAATNLSNTNPWGLWIGFDVLGGIALAAGGFVMAAAVYIFGLESYRPVVRAAILTAFLGYFFVAVGIMFDLGRPWRLPYPIFVSLGPTSVMLEVAWCVFWYLIVLALEFCPGFFEWLGWKSARQWAVKLTMVFVISGVVLSTLHQSSVGALFLLTPTKLHPLWYSPLLPLFFFISAIATGLTMVIVESTLSHRLLNGSSGPEHTERLNRITLGLAKAAGLVLFTYFWVKVIGLIHANQWDLLNTGMGYWFLVEMLGFVLLPSFMFVYAVRTSNVVLARVTAAITVIGVVLNRLNIAIIAFNWNVPDRYVPRWSEIAITLMIVTTAVLLFRWIVNRMPVLKEHPEYPTGH